MRRILCLGQHKTLGIFNMKKIISIFIIVATIFVMSGCSLKKCDICDGFGADYEVQAVTTWYLCYDCYREFKNDYDYDYDYGNSNGNSNNRCSDCGKSIPSGRYYCDKCLGYGTCQDCGKSIDSDRLYCDKCLGYGTCQDCGKKISDNRLYCNDCLYD